MCGKERRGISLFNNRNNDKRSSSRTLPCKSGSMRSQKSLSSGHIVANTTSTSNAVTDSTSLRGGNSQRSLGWVIGGGTLDTGLHFGKLEELLCARIPSYFQKIKSTQFRGIASRSSEKQQDLLRPAICYLEDALAANESKHFSFDVLVDIQSSLGMMYESQGDSRTAIDYFMCALWLLHKPFKSGGSCAKGYDLNTQVALNLYRLGACYGRLGDSERMQEAYERAECFREGDIFIAAMRP